MNVVVVESPAKAKTINKYLGSQYTVLASFGHVRDLPPKDGSVKPDEDFAMAWEVDTQSAKRVKAIADAVKESDKLILATDPDREGEAISWHLLEALTKRRVLDGFKTIKVCGAYEVDGERLDHLPAGKEAQAKAKPTALGVGGAYAGAALPALPAFRPPQEGVQRGPRRPTAPKRHLTQTLHCCF